MSKPSLSIPVVDIPAPWAEQAPTLSWLVDAIQPAVAVQIGVGEGFSYLTLCQAVDELGLPTRCHGIDTFASGEHSGFYGPELLERLRSVHDPRYGAFSTLTPGEAIEVVGSFDDGSVDLLFIDMLTDVEVFTDLLESWGPKLSDSAVLLVHNVSLLMPDVGASELWGWVSERYEAFEFTHGRGLGVAAIGPKPPSRISELCALAPDGDEAAAIRRLYERLGSTLVALAGQRDERSVRDALDEVHESELRTVRLEADARALEADARIKDIVHESDTRLEVSRQLEAELRSEIDRQHGRIAELGDSLTAQTLESDRLDRDREALADELDQSNARLASTRAQAQREAEASRAKQKQMLERAQKAERRYERLRNRRTVRFALRVADLFRPLFRFVRGQSKPKANTSGDDGGGVQRSLRSTVRAIEAQREVDASSSGPQVTIVMLSRNGAHHLRRVLGGLRDRTDYQSFDLIVVDNGSTDSTGEVLAEDWGFPIQVIWNERNESFSHGCNQGLALASGDYVLLMNNDTDPINAGWLGAMVDALESDLSRVAAGALLVYPDSDDEGRVDEALTVQHRGIGFRWRLGTPVGFNLGHGEDPTEAGLAQTTDVPGVTAACMLIRTATLKELGGLDERYVYGFEDVDLNLRIREADGSVVLVGQAALFHYEFGTQEAHGAKRQRSYRIANLQHFAERWSPRLSRTVRRDVLDPSNPDWLGRPERTVAITLTQDDPSKGWGDWYTAHELGDAFAKLGWDVIYAEAYRDRWLDLPENVDLVIGLLDRYDARTAPDGAMTVAWIRNWTDRWLERPWVGAYDVVITSSEISRGLVRDAGVDVAGILPLATNPSRFNSGAEDAVYMSDYTFTGNHWGANRKLLNLLDVAPGETFSIYGKGWEDVGRASRYWRGHADYADLPVIYASAKVVLDDTAGPTLPYGAINSRVFDALASGTLVISDNAAGSEEVFDGLLPTYGDREELRDLLDTYLGDEDRREALASQLQAAVLANHTYDRRATQILDLCRRRNLAPSVAIKIGPPNHEEADRWGDTHFARAFAGALQRQGWRTRIDILPEWDRLDAQDVDVAIHLRGLMPYVPKPGQVNVLWIISHPEDVTVAECERYDLVLVASIPHASALADRVSVPVVPLLQATAFGRGRRNEDTWNPPGPLEVLFVGNSRRVDRPAVRWAIERELPLVVYGSDWDEGLVGDNLAGEHLENRHLEQAYGSAAIVLNDHWPDMRAAGFISNRLFDVLASGGFVVSDEVEGLDEVFGDWVPTFADADELERQVAYFLEHDDQRRAKAEAARAAVLSEHTFDRRARQFVELVQPVLADRRPMIEESEWMIDGDVATAIARPQVATSES